MGKIEKIEDKIVYRQENGEITAWLTDFEEKSELRHQGSAFYKKVFYLTVALALAYLGTVFVLYG